MDFILPELGEGIEEATVSFWMCEKWDDVNKGDDVIEMLTDKATFNVPAPVSGVLKDILVKEGDVVKVGQKIAEIGE